MRSVSLLLDLGKAESKDCVDHRERNMKDDELKERVKQ
jgi:hypothetical protein